jgi:predicted PurR-regulated permease PerM
MRNRSAEAFGRHPVVITFLILAIIAFLWWASPVFKPVAVAVLVALAISPLVRWLEKRGVPRVVGGLVSVALSLGLVGLVLFQMARDLTGLLDRMPEYEANITAKLKSARSGGPDTFSKASQAIERIEEAIEGDAPPAAEPALPGVGAGGAAAAAAASAPSVLERREPKPIKVEVVEHTGLAERIEATIAPSVELGAQMFIVLTLAIFFVTGAEELVGRLVRVVGTERVTVTVQTLNDAGARIGRYLALFTGMNAATGVVIGLAMWALGLEYPILWGALSAVFRFVPYLGPVLTLALPVAFSLGSGPSLMQPVLIGLVILGIEMLNNFVLEPILYGKGTNVSPLGLVIAALFWAWLWGPIGLIMSTALTVSLTVAGKYIPALRFLNILFGEEVGIDDEVRFYQKLVARDEDAARDLLEEATDEADRREAFDRFLVPALARARRDLDRGSMDADDLDYMRKVVETTLDELHVPPAAADPDCTRIAAVGVAVDGRDDELALRMLERVTAGSCVDLTILEDARDSIRITEGLRETTPEVIILSHVPPGGLTQIRYLARKLRALYPGVPILAGLWTNQELEEGLAERTRQSGATSVATSLREAAAWLEARTRSGEGFRGAEPDEPPNPPGRGVADVSTVV